MPSLVSIRSDLTSALKAKDSVRLSTLRMLLAAITNMAIAKYGSQAEEKLTESDVLETIKKQAKTHKESIVAFEQAERSELRDKEQAELDILQTYLSKEISDEELKALLLGVVQSGETDLPAGRQDFGLLMKRAMASIGGKAEGGRVASILKQLIKQ